MILILSILPLLALGQNTRAKQSTQLTKECTKLAENHRSECEPVFSNVDDFVTLCPKSGSCSLEQKKKPLNPICSNITKLKNCYKVLTPACYSQKVTDSVVKIFESECKKVSGGSKTTQSPDAKDSKTDSKDTTKAPKETTGKTKEKTTEAKEMTDNSKEKMEEETEKSSGETLFSGTNSLFLAVLLALSIL